MGRRVIALLLTLTAALAVRAQQYRDDFENGYTWYPPWHNIVIATDSVSAGHGNVCECAATREFGLGFNYQVHDTLRGYNLRLQFEADCRFPDTIAGGDIVLSISHNEETRYWNSYRLAQYANDDAEWFHFAIDVNLPADYIDGSTIKSFLWNHERRHILIDNASVTLTPWTMPSFLPDIVTTGSPPPPTPTFQLSAPNDTLPLTYPIGMLTEYLLDGDTATHYQRFQRTEDGRWMTVSDIDTTYATSWLQDNPYLQHITLSSKFHKDCQLLRQALVVPFIDSTLTVYRRNQTIDSVLFQTAYYLDREGFKVGEGSRTVISYHPYGLSSTQLDAARRVAYFNLDYWRDHPLIHYPMSDTVKDVFEEASARRVHNGMEWSHQIDLYVGDELKDLPRIMPVPYGYEAGIIFTEHADWSDLRTHRAVYYGSESVVTPRQAIGGFVYYGIPVTKSVFYNNPDHVTNAEVSHGTFTGLHATIKTDKGFFKFLRQLYGLGYEICLHTPEQYTTTPGNLNEALNFMRRHFKSVSWIDHGYNNGMRNNREDMVCDGLNPKSDFYVASLWQRNGIRYPWNAYYEERRMTRWDFDNNLMQPYPGFGDALPNRQITTIADYDRERHPWGEEPTSQPDFLTWSTPSTMEATKDANWDFFFSKERLQKLIDQHSVFFTHIYPAWVMHGRTFWTFDADSTIVALPGMNRALERIATLRDEHLLLPMTVQTYLNHYEGLLQVYYEIIDAEHIRLHNNGKAVKGFTLCCQAPLRFDDNRFYEYRESGGQYYIWFDLKAHDSVTISIK